jgi:hypothetical protein
MKTNKYLYIVLCPFVLFMSSCEPKALTEDDVFGGSLEQKLQAENPEGYDLYNLDEFLDIYMTEQGNFWSDTSQYRSRSTNGNGIYLYTVDTLPTNGRGIYIRGRVTTDDFGGNFYKSLVIQQVKDWHTGADIDQQNLRISVDLGSSGGMYQIGQEIMIRCNGLSVGRYANQPQLCVPSYNNNIYALSASEKVGWCPGRIPSARFRAATHTIGAPDRSKLIYDELTLEQLYQKIDRIPAVDEAGMAKVRKMDGRLVRIVNVHFNGKYSDQGSIATCEYDDPERKDSKANVFAPTTNNVGYPQNRIIEDGSFTLCCSNSEYAKFAYYFIPGADTNGVAGCVNYEGSVAGILGWYCDNATGTKAGTLKNLTGYEWSITPRGIPGIGISDINMCFQGNEEQPWVPKEFDPQEYKRIQDEKNAQSEN